MANVAFAGKVLPWRFPSLPKMSVDIVFNASVVQTVADGLGVKLAEYEAEDILIANRKQLVADCNLAAIPILEAAIRRRVMQKQFIDVPRFDGVRAQK